MEYYLVGYLLTSILVLCYFWIKFKKITKRANTIDLSTIPKEDLHKINWIDARTFREVENTSIEGTIQIPWDNIYNNDFQKEDKIVIFCNSGIRSSKAAENLQHAGYLNVFYYNGHYSEIKKLLEH